MATLTVFIDYKSPYAYLAKDPVYALAEETGCSLDWLPYTLDIPSYLGSAELGPDGAVIAGERSAHQWRRVRYAYMDCRRQANKRGLIILGTRKIWDSSIAAIGMLYAKEQGHSELRGYTDRVFERFWRRALNIENPEIVQNVLAEAGADVRDFEAFLAGPGRAQHDRIRAEAEAAGVFGVPSFVLEGELFWGREHLDDIRALLTNRVR